MKEHSLHQYIPLDAHLEFHKVVACTSLFFTVLHVMGHLVNFYHIATQPVAHLHCLSSELNFASDERPSIAYWLFQSLTGWYQIIISNKVIMLNDMLGNTH